MKQPTITKNVPRNLSQFKKFLTPDTKIRVKNINVEGEVTKERETFIKRTQSNAVITDRDGRDCWMDFGKASEWLFDNEGATQHVTQKDGEPTPILRVEYI